MSAAVTAAGYLYAAHRLGGARRRRERDVNAAAAVIQRQEGLPLEQARRKALREWHARRRA